MSTKIAIIGTGPSGCYLAQALLKADPELGVDLIDSLPVPYGLVRYGVAADHQGTKAVIRQFERIFERQGAQFIGNLTIGRDVTLEEVRAAYDVVVLASGLSADRSLGIEGEDGAGIYRAGALTRALYDHPDADALPELGEHVVIMGNGNVAIDLLRVLAKTEAELDGTDFGPVASAWLAANQIKDITIVGRSAAAAAKFDPVMVKELGKLQGVTISVTDAGQSDDPVEAKKLAALAEIDGVAQGPLGIRFRFGLTPQRINADAGRISSITFATESGEEETLPASALLTAIGFDDQGTLARDRLIAEAEDAEAGVLAPGLYATGWFRRGPQGTIPQNRSDARDLAARILADLAAAPKAAERPGAAAIIGGVETVNYDQWKRMDAAELAAADSTRCRVKLATRQDMLRLARQHEGE